MTEKAGLAGFRSDLYTCLTGWRDALFELCDAVLCSPSPVASVPWLSLEPVFRRGHGSLYKALARGRVDSHRLRRLLVANLPAQWPLVSPLTRRHGTAAMPRPAPSAGSTTPRRSTPQDSRSWPAGTSSGSAS